MSVTQNILSSTANKQELNDQSMESDTSPLPDSNNVQDQLEDSVNLGSMSNNNSAENNYHQLMQHNIALGNHKQQKSDNMMANLEKNAKSIQKKLLQKQKADKSAQESNEDPSQQTLMYLDALGELANANPALNGLLLNIQSGIRK